MTAKTIVRCTPKFEESTEGGTNHKYQRQPQQGTVSGELLATRGLNKFYHANQTLSFYRCSKHLVSDNHLTHHCIVTVNILINYA